MTRFIAAVAMACAFLALAIPSADAKPRKARIAHAVAVQCFSTAPGREACPNAAAPVAGRRAAHMTDANGNAVTRHEAAAGARRGLCTAETAAGRIMIACDLESRMRGFIADVVARGFRGRVHCFATGGHVRNSLHYRGEACDFAQRGWNKTVRPMYRVADLAVKWGLRDGCSFRDCGHIDSGRSLARVPWPARLAEMKRRAVTR